MAGRIPDEFIRSLLAGVDLAALVGETVTLKRAGGSHKGLCPFHNEKGPSFHVSNVRGMYHCFGCGAGGDAVKFVMQTRLMGFVEAIEWLADRQGVQVVYEQADPLELQRRAEARSERARLIDLARIVQQFFRSRFDLPQGAAARAYASQRQLSAETIQRFGLGAAGDGWTDLSDHCLRLGWPEDDLLQLGVSARRKTGGLYDTFRQRLMMPIFSHQGEVVGFVGRDLTGEADAKYKNSPEVRLRSVPESHRFSHLYKKGDLLFGLWQAAAAIRRESKTVLLVEGNLDVMMIAQAGWPNVVCAGGTAVTDNQISALREVAEHVVLVFDGDDAGRREAKKVMPMLLRAGLDGRVVWLARAGEPKADPDSYLRDHGAEAFRAKIDQAPRLVSAWIDSLVEQWDGTSLGAAPVLEAARPVLDAIGAREPITRDLARDQLVARLRDGQTDGQRVNYQKFLKPTVAKGRLSEEAAAQSTPQPPRPPLRELELLEIVLWYPVFLAELATSGALQALQDGAVREVLQALCAMAQAGGMDLEAVSRWVREQPDAAGVQLARECLMPETARVPAAQAALAFRDRAGRVVLEGLRRHIEHIAAQLRATPPEAPRHSELAEMLQFAQAERRQYEQALRNLAASPPRV